MMTRDGWPVSVLARCRLSALILQCSSKESELTGRRHGWLTVWHRPDWVFMPIAVRGPFLVVDGGVGVAGSWRSDDDGTFLLDGVCIFVRVARSAGVPCHVGVLYQFLPRLPLINRATFF